MRVLYVVSLFPCWSETFIVREIAELVRAGVQVRILSLRHPSESLVQSDAAALLGRVVYPARGLAAWRAALGALMRAPCTELAHLARLCGGLWRHPASLAKSVVAWARTLSTLGELSAFAPHHIHAHFATYPSTVALLLSRRLGVPFSFTAHAHDIFLEDHLLAWKMRASAFSVAISRFNREFIARRLGHDATRTMRIVHCGISPAVFSFRPEGRDPARILAVGRLDEIKGFRHLVDACALLRDRGMAFACEIVGSGPLGRELAAQIARLGLGGHVRLLGARKQEEVREMLMRAGVFALPSVVARRGDRDGIPVALMEAMACGAPVVSTRVSGIPELVRDGITGLLANPGDASQLAGCLQRLLADPAYGARLAQRARAAVERDFDIGREAGKLMEAIGRAA
ncbi:MAG TPA: glycosyltransferase [Usitatibacter sp.]|nr:glycosyltransferase [Usitatibacter sp.]